MKTVPVRRKQFDLPKFAAWLAVNGAEVSVPTNPYEVIRYRAFWHGSKSAVTHVVYTKENGLLTFTSGSRQHYEAFLAGAALTDQRPRAVPPTDPRPSATKGEITRERLIDRDGCDCWFCGRELGDDCTIEHLVPKSKRGANHLDNYVLAHAACNARAADMPLVQKIALRTALHNEVNA